MRLHSVLKIVVAAAAFTLAGTAAAQVAYPDRPIRIIVPIAAGSVTDVVLRAAGQELAPRLGQAIVIDNKPGASGIVGAEACARAVPDGYTVCAVYHATMSFNPLTHDKLPYDPQKDLLPVGQLFFVTEGLFAPAPLAVSTVAELRAYAARNPKALNFGTLGEGSLQELMVAWLNNEWKSDIVGVPYKGGGPISTAISGGEIQLAQMGIGNFIGVMQGGKVKLLAVSGSKRHPSLPQVPSAAEAGLAGFTARPWWGLAAPVGTPPAAIARLNAEFAKLFREPKFVEFLEARYVEPAVGSPQDFAAFLKADRDNAAALVQLARQAKR